MTWKESPVARPPFRPEARGLYGAALEPVLQMLECLECILFPDHFLVSKERTVKL